MNRLFVLALMGSSAIGLSAAQAADIFVPQPPIEYVEKPSFSGWYIRGDVGYNFKSKNTGEWDFYNIFPGFEGVDDTFAYRNYDFNDGASFGGGVGYRFTDQFRVDATLDYFSTDFDSDRQCPSYVAASQFGQAAPNIDCRYKDDADVDIWTAMANAYVDLPGFSTIFTPYVGAGIGAAYVDYGKLTVEQCGFTCGDPTNIFFDNEGEGDWRLAGSLMAGATIKLTDSLELDAGYKYTRIAEGDAFGFDDPDRAAGATGIQFRDHGFDIHAVRAGLRYSFF